MSTYHGSMSVEHCVLNTKALVGAFNIVGAFSMIVKLRVIFGNLRFKLYWQFIAV